MLQLLVFKTCHILISIAPEFELIVFCNNSTKQIFFDFVEILSLYLAIFFVYTSMLCATE